MKVWKIAIALFCILFAVFGLLEAIGVTPPMESVVGEMSLWRMVCALFLLAIVINFVCKLKVCRTIFFLSLLFMVVEPNIAYVCGVKSGNLINNWLLLLYTVLICIGLSLILGAIPGRRKMRISVTNGVNVSGKGYTENNLCSRTVYIDCTTFTEQYMENNMGSTVIRFENADAYTGGGALYIENNLGSVEVCVPENWSVNCQVENNLGGTKNRANGGTGPSLTVRGENNLGSIDIKTC